MKLLILLLCIACVQAMQIQIFFIQPIQPIQPIKPIGQKIEQKIEQNMEKTIGDQIEIIEIDDDIIYEKYENASTGYFNNRNKFIKY